MNINLKEKEKLSLNTIKKEYDKDSAIAWTGGKDSTLVLYLVRKVVKSIYPVIFLDSGREFPEIYHFVDKLKNKWSLNVRVFKYNAPTAKDARINKIKALKKAIKELKIKKLFIGIRWDEHESRSKEKYISSRKNHERIHPILHWKEEDLWKYTKEKEIPYCKLYDEGYRSLGEKPFTKKSKGEERSGRNKDKEQDMERLRALGYF